MNESRPTLDRREFAARVAAGTTLLPAMLAALGASDENMAAGAEPAKANGAKPDQPLPKDPLAEKPGAEKPAPVRFNPVAVQLELLLGQYPSEQLTPEGLRIIAGKLASQLAHSARLGSFPLTNADGPGFVFSAYRSP